MAIETLKQAKAVLPRLPKHLDPNRWYTHAAYAAVGGAGIVGLTVGAGLPPGLGFAIATMVGGAVGIAIEVLDHYDGDPSTYVDGWDAGFTAAGAALGAAALWLLMAIIR